MKFFKVLIISSLLVLLHGCEQPKWFSFVYPNKNDLFQYNSSGPYTTLEECKASAEKELADLYATDKGYYQCGQDCISGTTGLISVASCEDIVR